MLTLIKRTLSTVILFGILYCAVFLPYKLRIICFVFLCIFLSYGVTWEFCRIVNNDEKFRLVNLFSAILIPAVVIVDFIFYEKILCITILEIIVFCLLSWFIVLLLCKKKDYMLAVFKAYMIIVSFSVSIKTIMFFYFSDNTPSSLPVTFLLFILVTKSGDIGAYLFGTLCNSISKGNNHKLIPSVSPGKSWEGLIGGFLFTLIVCFTILNVFSDNKTGIAHNDYFTMTIVSVVLFLGSMLGDLSESSIKRTFVVKDSGSCLPGIGGLFDLTDSLIVNSLVYFLVLNFIRS